MKHILPIILSLISVTLQGACAEYGPGGVPVHPEWPYTMASRSIPLLHINTEDYQPILDKENYLPGTLAIEVPVGQNRWTAFATPDEPVALEIRGRGNFTWTKTEKKAYKLKLKKKASLLDMPAHKHYALISYDNFYTCGWMGPYVGMEVCRMVQPDWVPRMEPVEVVLNGEYRGIYLLVESMKIDENRLDIEVQDEEETDPEKIAGGGWLVEFDNQNDEFQISVPSQNKNGVLLVTYKEPEVISDAQRDWLIGEFTYLSDLLDNPALYPDDRWEEHIDVESVARYMVIREFLHDLDGYSGSQYFHRSVGAEKWKAGPMWDMEIWPAPKPGWIRDYPRWAIMNWIPAMMDSDQLKEAFAKTWKDFYPASIKPLDAFIDDTEACYASADKANALRWPEEATPLAERTYKLKKDLHHNGRWIDNNLDWTPAPKVPTSVALIDNGTETPVVLTKDGLKVTAKNESRLIIHAIDGTILQSTSVSAGTNVIPCTAIRGFGLSLAELVDSDGSRRITKIIL